MRGFSASNFKMAGQDWPIFAGPRPADGAKLQPGGLLFLSRRSS
jgi:hypothetical protein